MTSIGMSTFSLFLPPIEREFGLSRSLATLPYMVAMMGWAAGAVTFGKLADDRGSRPVVLGLSYLTRGAGTLLMALDITNEIAYYAVVALAIGPTFGTVAVGNVLFYELVGPRMAGVILGMSFIVHQVGSAGGPMIASITFDRTGSYDGFMLVMSLILLASGLLLFREKNTDAVPMGAAPLASRSPR